MENILEFLNRSVGNDYNQGQHHTILNLCQYLYYKDIEDLDEDLDEVVSELKTIVDQYDVIERGSQYDDGMDGAYFILQDKDGVDIYKIEFTFCSMNGCFPPQKLEDFCYKVSAASVIKTEYSRI